MISRSDLPRVTHILDAAGLSPDLSGIAPAILERARRRGTALHEAIEAHTYDYLDRGAMDEEAKGYLAGYERFLAETGYKPVVSEVEVVSEKWGYIGHADGIGWIGTERCLPDWKSVASLDVASVSYQLAAYKLAYEEQRPTEPIKRLLAIQFKPNGTYKMFAVTDPRAESVFLAALTVYHARKRR